MVSAKFGAAMIPYPVFALIDAVLQLANLVVIIGVILSWLLAFNVLNRGNRFVDMIWRSTEALSEPMLWPIRRMLPPMSGVDLSPLVLLIGIWFLRMMNAWIGARIGVQ
jgi:YggT family protein